MRPATSPISRVASGIGAPADSFMRDAGAEHLDQPGRRIRIIDVAAASRIRGVPFGVQVMQARRDSGS